MENIVKSILEVIEMENIDLDGVDYGYFKNDNKPVILFRYDDIIETNEEIDEKDYYYYVYWLQNSVKKVYGIDVNIFELVDLGYIYLENSDSLKRCNKCNCLLKPDEYTFTKPRNLFITICKEDCNN